MPRLFTAIALPDQVKDVLSSIGGGIRHARWLDYDQLHMTLVFLGDVPQATIPALTERLERIDWQPLDIHVRDLGHFSTRGRPRVLWAGVSLSDELLRLQRANLAAIEGLGLKVQRRKFHPHVTIARLDRPASSEVSAYLQSNGGLTFSPFEADRFGLWQSHLAAEGASYSEVASFPAR